MRVVAHAIVWLIVMGGGCTRDGAGKGSVDEASSRPRSRPAARAEGPPGADLVIYGSLHSVMMRGEHGPKADLENDLPPGPLHGVGALEGLRGEVTFDQGELWLSTVSDKDDGVDTQRLTPEEGYRGRAALLGVVPVPAWRSVQLKASISMRALARRVRWEASRMGVDDDTPVPFRVEGRLSSLRFHVIDGRRLPEGPSSHLAHQEAAAVFEVEDVEGRLIGFEGADLVGRLVHHNATSHIHVTLPDRGLSGHVDAVTVAPGSSLFLPE